MKTNSIPRTPNYPAEHFIAVAFPRQDFIELVFARFKLVDGTGCSFIFSHRIYGEKAGDQASAWLKTNAPATEKALMEWSSLPAPASLPMRNDFVNDHFHLNNTIPPFCAQTYFRVRSFSS